MAPPHVRFERDPIEILSTKGLRVMGKCIAQWCVDPIKRPPNTRIEAGGRLVVFSKEDFLAHLEALPEEERLTRRDIRIRDDVKEIELIVRRDDRLSILLPDPEALKHQKVIQQRGHPVAVMLPTLYQLLNKDDQQGKPWMDVNLDVTDLDPKTEEMRLIGGDPFEQFLYPYLASYLCAQCT